MNGEHFIESLKRQLSGGLKHKSLLTIVLFALFLNTSQAGCGWFGSYSTNTISNSSFNGSGSATYDIYMNSGDTLRVHAASDDVCPMSNLYWIYNGVGISDTTVGSTSINYKGYKEGKYELHVNWDYFNGYITFNVFLNPTPVQEYYINQNIFKIYPNPFLDRLSLNIKNVNAGKIKLIIQNTLGQTVWTEDEINSLGDIKREIDLMNLLNGIYFLQATIDNKQSVIKLIKQ